MPRLNSTTSAFRFSGVTSPNTTQVPDQYLDELLPILSGAELKVLLYITRRTFGFKKAADNISLSQMLNGIRTSDGRQLDSGCGLTKKTLLHAIRSLEERNIIVTQRRRSVERGDEPTSYQLHIRNQASEQHATPPVGEKLHQGGGVKTPPGPWGKNSPTQQTVKQQTDFDLSNHSNGKNLAEETVERQKSNSPESEDSQHSTGPTARHADEPPLKALVARRAPKRQSGAEDRQAIGVIIEDFASELGDQAPTRSSITRALNLFERSATSRDGFIDLLFQARAATREMRASSKRPSKPMAYFFSVVEQRIGASK